MSPNNTMKSMIKEEPKKGYYYTDLPVPEPVKDEVLIKVEKVAICGSDINLFLWNEFAKVIATIPFTPGHEATGVVVKAGPEATLEVGTKVAVENHFYCGDCYTCEEGRGDICAKMDQYGHGRGTVHGGCSQFSIVRSKYCYQMKRDITPTQAVLLEPMGVAYNGIEKIDVKGKDILIIGAGAIGLLGAACAKALGASKIIVADIIKGRLELAKKMGADVTIDCSEKDLLAEVLAITDGNGVSRLMEASGNHNMLNASFKMMRKGANIVLVGLPKEPIHIEEPAKNVIFKNITLKTVHGRRIWSTWEDCEALIADGKVKPELIVSHEFPMSKWEDAFTALFSKDSCKIIMDPQC